MCKTTDFILDLQERFMLDDEMMCDILNVTQREFIKNKLTSNWKYKQIERLSELFKVNFNQITENSVDLNHIKKMFYTPSESINPRYTDQAGTYMSNIKAFFDYIRTRYNEKSALHDMNLFGLSREILISDTKMVNLKLVNDILVYLQETYKMEQKDYCAMALRSFGLNSRGEFVKKKSNFRTDFDLIESLANNSLQYEMNFDYSVQRYDDNTFFLKSHAKEKIQDLFKNEEVSSLPTSLFKAECLRVTPLLMGREQFNILHIRDEKVKGVQHIDYYIKEASGCNL
jgi:hypothetical protein